MLVVFVLDNKFLLQFGPDTIQEVPGMLFCYSKNIQINIISGKTYNIVLLKINVVKEDLHIELTQIGCHPVVASEQLNTSA